MNRPQNAPADAGGIGTSPLIFPTDAERVRRLEAEHTPPHPPESGCSACAERGRAVPELDPGPAAVLGCNSCWAMGRAAQALKPGDGCPWCRAGELVVLPAPTPALFAGADPADHLEKTKRDGPLDKAKSLAHSIRLAAAREHLAEVPFTIHSDERVRYVAFEMRLSNREAAELVAELEAEPKPERWLVLMGPHRFIMPGQDVPGGLVAAASALLEHIAGTTLELGDEITFQRVK